jgi:hypothetical protein
MYPRTAPSRLLAMGAAEGPQAPLVVVVVAP